MKSKFDEKLSALLTDPYATKTDVYEATIEYFRTIHSLCLAAHCECLAMNAENMWATIAWNDNPVYRSEDYYTVMRKWGIMDSLGNSLI